MLDETNDPNRRSWLTTANRAQSDFPVQNLPIGIFRRRGTGEPYRGGIAIGDQVLDLAALAAAGRFAGDAATALAAASGPVLNELMQLGPRRWSALRRAAFTGLIEGAAEQALFERCLVPQSKAEYALPAQIGDFTDFYTSIHHATAVGRLFRPDSPLPPNYKWLPIGYHGRSSSIVVSGHPIERPRGQHLAPGRSEPQVAPSARLDYELELGIFVGGGNPLGEPIALEATESHVFGLCLLNDWSARDIQAWEYQPLGPFLAKSFATTLSPWIVSLQALAPFRLAHSRPAGDPRLPGYLGSPRNEACGAFDIRLAVDLDTQHMRRRGEPAARVSCTSFRHSYWTIAQLLAHHTINGCNLRAGDLLGTGTQSGPHADEAGSLLELSAGGRRPIVLASGETRTFLEDGDAVILNGWCERSGVPRIGFGEARGEILPARTASAEPPGGGSSA